MLLAAAGRGTSAWQRLHQGALLLPLLLLPLLPVLLPPSPPSRREGRPLGACASSCSLADSVQRGASVSVVLCVCV